MSRPQTLEQKILFDIEEYINSIVSSFSEKMSFLEACSAYKTNADIYSYWKLFGITACEFNEKKISKAIDMIEQCDIPFEMAITTLMREPISLEEQRKCGAFYTDFRLSEYISEYNKELLFEGINVADYAAGTGILLIGIAQKYKECFPNSFDSWIANHLFAFDLSENALRGVAAAILSMTSNIMSIHKMTQKWKICDSLLDNEIDSHKVDLIIGNPPWGKIKLTRHAFSLKENSGRIYGSAYKDLDYAKYSNERKNLSAYCKALKDKYNLLAKTEPDMYMAFLQKAIQKAAINNGTVSFLIPAGIIRSQGTKELREYIFSNCENVEIDLLDNKSNFFSIDSRFKFVILFIKKINKKKSDKIILGTCKSDNKKVYRQDSVNILIDDLRKHRKDLTIPEVKNNDELALFYKICNNGVVWGNEDNQWKASICREVDMTNDKNKFSLTAINSDSFPVIEGRMVQQHRFGVKSYVSGTGRSAKWDPCSNGGKPQFYISKNYLSESMLNRIQKKRVGYCDIAGQTNERAMMSSIIPRNVVCGNKVPTICFDNANEDILYLWVGITNSLIFDWMIRRVISTTINYFLLFSIPMPNINSNPKITDRIIKLSKKLENMKLDYYQNNIMGDIRAEIDVLVAELYGLTFEDLELIIKDFPILDRKQPKFTDESKSYVTRDALLSFAEKKWNKSSNKYTNRYIEGKKIGAKAYIPTEMTTLS